MKNQSSLSLCFRYEFSDEKGRPEGGDIFTYKTLAEAQKMMGEVLKVAQADGVSVSFMIGQGEPFFDFLKNNGISRKEAEKEKVDAHVNPTTPAKAKKKSAKKKAKKKNKKA